MTTMTHLDTGFGDLDRRAPAQEAAQGQPSPSSACGGDVYPHQFVTEQAGAALSRIVCSMCGTVRIEQRLDRNLVLTWSRTDYEIADRFYRELVS